MRAFLIALVLAVAATTAFLLTRDDDHGLAFGAPGYTARGGLIHDHALLDRAARAWTPTRVLWAGRRDGHQLVVLADAHSAAAVRDGRLASVTPFDPADAFVPVGDELLLSDTAAPAFHTADGILTGSSGARLGGRPVSAPALLGRQIPLLVPPARTRLYVPPGAEADTMRDALADRRDRALTLAALRAAMMAGPGGTFAVVLGRSDIVQAPLGLGLGTRAVGVAVLSRSGSRSVYAVGYREREGAPVHGELIAAGSGSLAVRALPPGWIAVAGGPRIARLGIDTDSAELQVRGRFAIVSSTFAGANPEVRGYTARGKVIGPVTCGAACVNPG